MSKESRIILALDVHPEKAEYFLDLSMHYINIVKIGPVLYFASGEKILDMAEKRGLEVFLDFKHFDIPNTVSFTAEMLARRRIKMFTVHTFGGKEMLKATKEKLKKVNHPPLVIGITVLTSWDEENINRLGIPLSIKELTLRLVKEGIEGGVDGFVCSPSEVSDIKKIAPGRILITPGIRPSKTLDDQKRISTPSEAIRRGADYIVIGRPVLKAENPEKALLEIIEEVKSANNIRR